jgi:hypothetical protein
MKRLDQVIGREVIVDGKVKRYALLYYSSYRGWEFGHGTHTTPESAIEEVVRIAKWNKDSEDTYPKYYKVVEVEVEIITNV